MKLKILSTVKTNNFTDKEIANKIGKLWVQNDEGVKRLFAENASVFAVYHDYESNYQGDYAVSLCFVDNENGEFDTSSYRWLEYSVNSESKTGVLETWQQIWQEEENGELSRVYVFDYEEYKGNGQVSVKIGIKS